MAQHPEEFWATELAIIVEQTIHTQQSSLSVPFNFLMAELASNSIGAESVFPKTIALSLPKTFSWLHVDQFMDSVSKAALVSIGASSKFWEILA